MANLLRHLAVLGVCGWTHTQDPIEVKTNDGGGVPVVRLSLNSGSPTTELRIQNARLKLHSAAYLNVASDTPTGSAGDIRYASGSLLYRDQNGEQTLVSAATAQTISGSKTFTGVLTQSYSGTNTAHTLTANAVTSSYGLDISVTGLTAGRGLSVTGPSAGANMVGSVIRASSHLGDGGSVLNLLGTTVITSGEASGAKIGMTNSPASGSNRAAGLHSTVTDSTPLGTSIGGVYGEALDSGELSSLVTKNVAAGVFNATQSGAIQDGVANVYGVQSTATKSGIPIGGISNVYGLSASATAGTGGTQNAYGAYVSANGGDDLYGLYSTVTLDGSPTTGTSGYFALTLTKDDPNSRTFQGLTVKPTLNPGGSNANTTLNVVEIDTINSNTTGVTTNLLKISYGGSQRLLLDSSGRMMIGAGSPAAGFDLRGSLAQRESRLSLSNGENNNVSLGTDAVMYRITGPSALFSVTGIAGGVDGRTILLHNPTGQAMTIKHNSSSSSAPNRIQVPAGADLTITGAGFLTFYYSTTDSRWNLVTPISRIGLSKATDESLAGSDTFQDDDDLHLAVGTNEAWYVDFHLFVNTGDSPNPDIRFQFTGPAGATIKMSLFDETGIASKIIAAFLADTGPIAIGANQTHVLRFRGLITTASSGGTVALQWAQNTPHATATVVEARSFLMAQRR